MSGEGSRTTRHCILSETGDRWRQSIWRFVPSWLEEGETLDVQQVRPQEVPAEIERRRAGLLLWEVRAERLAEDCHSIATAEVNRSAWLQVVAVDRLSAADRCALTQWGVAAFVDHPEAFAALQPLVTGHFARAAGLLH